MKKPLSPEILIGAHTSAQGGLENALWEGQSIGASTIQLFTANQRRWERKPLLKEKLSGFLSTLEATGLKKIMSHASYLINLGSPDPIILEKSRKCFREEITDCLSLKLSFVNIHPGAAVGSSKEQCLQTIVNSLLGIQDLFDNKMASSPMMLLLETTAGQGSLIGSCFEELAYILSHTQTKIPIGVCIDTCHIFASGYDIRTAANWINTLNEFDKTIGLENLKAMHLNDSVYDLGSKKDRHACLGAGKIGWESFAYIMQSTETKKLPKYLETPKGLESWREEILKLKESYVL